MKGELIISNRKINKRYCTTNYKNDINKRKKCVFSNAASHLQWGMETFLTTVFSKISFHPSSFPLIRRYNNIHIRLFHHFNPSTKLVLDVIRKKDIDIDAPYSIKLKNKDLIRLWSTKSNNIKNNHTWLNKLTKVLLIEISWYPTSVIKLLSSEYLMKMDQVP